MKKLLLSFAFCMMATLSMSAQDKELSLQSKAKNDMVALAQVVNLPENQQEDFFRLFEMKYEVLDNKNLSAERKLEMSRVIEAKIRGTLSPQQMAQLEANPELLNRLIGNKIK
ncbi:MAG: hypothetical protein ACK5RV_07270 [Flavobacterium sp.]|jgi:hypothetical protein|uniref:hypothetical protein n=1 Tax=Flavobacterium sp. TaxID=239 RepID=UPI0022C1ACA2|nr:hypothetical protein [Flavobacterium sp.]MCZ8169420.1 hypothetical protein [Flavobacterium sp.]MCZ8295843.1 hypothetical protein [Flavobacterium sp.]